MVGFKQLVAASIALTLAGSALAIEQTGIQTPPGQSAPTTSVLDSEYRLSQTATCILNGKRYNKGARMCIGGVYNYCNSRGQWEPSNLQC